MDDAHRKAAEMDREKLKKAVARHGSYAVLLDDAQVMLRKVEADRDWSDMGPRLRTALGKPHLGRWFCMMFHTFLAHDLSSLSTSQEHIAMGKASIKDIQFTFKAAGHSEEYTEATIGWARDMLQQIEVILQGLIDTAAKARDLIALCEQSIVETGETLSEAEIEEFQAPFKESMKKLEKQLSASGITSSHDSK
ncbi:hypothetical protein LTS10_011840 [Elasticomyces elasticus]|nr:hypothetical protein LTS10_011840 [Elasticomyces elasticus]